MQISNVTLRDCSIQDGMFRATVETPATPELEQAMKPKFAPWKPKHKDSHYYIGVEGEIWHCYWTDIAADRARLESGNCFPTRELAEWQAEAEQITRRFNQAAVVYGGQLHAQSPKYQGAHIGEYRTPSRVVFSQWSFRTPAQADVFSEAFESDLTRLAELNAQITTGWQPFLSVEGKSNG